MGETTRPLPPLIPLSHGGWEARSLLSSAEYTIRGLGLMPSNTVIPVIVVPGIMGTNLRAKRNPRLGWRQDELNELAAPGEAVWRPPNGKGDGWRESSRWDQRTPADRQRFFNAASLEVDDSGLINFPDVQDEYLLNEADVRERGWGEVHAESYGTLLYTLQTQLNQTFEFDDQTKSRAVHTHWKAVMACEPRKWGVRDFAPLTEAQLEKHAKNYYPVYCVGYNWLEDCDASSLRLERRIREILGSWVQAKRKCNQVILVTHSMGGLVARACARRIPGMIAGIIHGVMPALGAPAAYRRLACGTESSSPSNNPKEELTAVRTAKLIGNTAERTTPVLATSPGAIELLPNHLYPGPWLHVRVLKVAGNSGSLSEKNNLTGIIETPSDHLHLPGGKVSNPYDLYRDMTPWYRLINPGLADPARKYRKQDGGVESVITSAINAAEKFHRDLGDYYHPNTYAFYGDDPRRLSYSQVRWVARQWGSTTTVLTTSSVANARFLSQSSDSHRRVLIEGKTELSFSPDVQDARGDGTVPHLSGAGPRSKVKQVFPTLGFDHQESYNNSDMLMLTLRLVVKIVQEMA